MSKKSNKKEEIPWPVVIIIFMFFSIYLMYIADKIFYGEDYTPPDIACNDKGMHYTGEHNHNMTRCEDDYGNIRWIQR